MKQTSKQAIAVFQLLTLALVTASIIIFARGAFTPDYQTVADIESLVEEWTEEDATTETPTLSKQPNPTPLASTPQRGDRIGRFLVSSPWGWRIHPISGTRKLHRGVDLAMPEGTPYYFPGKYKGRVQCFLDLSGGGFIAQMRSSSYPGLRLELLHLQKGSCKSGTKQPGEVVGKVGSSGASTGPHAHFQMVAVENGRRHHRPPSRTPLIEIVRGKNG